MNGLTQIQEMYENENHLEAHADQFVKVSLRMRVEDAALFHAIAERFNTTRIELLEPIFRKTSNEMFQGLTPEDRKQVGGTADFIATEMLKKQGITVQNYSNSNGAVDEVCFWSGYADAVNQSETDTLGDE